MQGRSLKPILEGHTPDDSRKAFYYHYYEYPKPHHVRPHYGVVTDRYKLIRFYKPDVDYWELFDREKDPQELRSFYADFEYAQVTKDLMAQLTQLRHDLKVPDAEPDWVFGGPRPGEPKKQGQGGKKQGAKAKAADEK